MDRRPRRGCLIAGAILGVVLVVGWWLLPRLACAVVNASLPREFGQQAVLVAVHPDCSGLPEPAIHLQASPGLFRRTAAAATGRWIPPGLVRDGLGAVGALRCEGGVSIPWRAEAAAGVEPPRLAISLTPAEADALITAAGGTMAIAGFEIVPRIAAAELAEVAGRAGIRRFRVEASGSLGLRGGSLAVDVPVRRLVGTIDVSFTPASGGWQPELGIAIDDLDAPLPNLPGIDRAAWRTLLAEAIERRIADRLAERSLPAWFATDLHVSAVVR